MSASVSGAVAYLGSRLGGETFTGASSTKQAQAVQSAIDTLSPYTVNMKEADADAAVYLQALWMMGARAQYQSDGVTSFGLSGISESFDLKGRPSFVAPDAWRVIKHGADGRGTNAAGGGVAWLS